MPSMTNIASPISGCIVMTPGTPVTPGRGFVANVVAAGNLKLTFANGSTMVIPVLVGYNHFDYSLTQVDVTASLPASGTFYTLY